MIETTHKGYTIRYDEAQDVWRSHELDFAAATLKAVRAKIDALDVAARRLDKIPVIHINWSGNAESATALSWATKDTLWIMKDRRRTREKCSNIALDTPEVRATLTRVKSLQQERTALNKQAEALIAEIPRWQPNTKDIADETEIETAP